MTTLYRPERCALCGKMQDNDIHRVPAPPTLLEKLTRLFWPRWLWGFTEGRHMFVSKAARVAASDRMARIKLALKKKRRTS